MNKYVLSLLMLMAISGTSQFALAEMLYPVPRIDSSRVEQKKEHFDRRFTRLKYIRHAGAAALAAGLVYYGYTAYTAPTPIIVDPDTPTVDTLIETVAKLQVRVAGLEKQQQESWVGYLANQSLFGVNLRMVANLALTPVFGHVASPFFDIDALWYQVLAEADYVKGITNQARRFATVRILNPMTPEEKSYLHHILQETTVSLKKQVERTVGFIRHKQAQYSQKDPIILASIDDKIRYLIIAYDDFAQKLEDLLNDSNLTVANMCLSVIACTDQFGQDYRMVKDDLKLLEEQLIESETVVLAAAA
jgi:hypothetical protein